MFKFLSSSIAVLLCAALAGCGREPVPTEGAKAPGRSNDGPLVLAVMPEVPPYAYVDRKTGEVCGIDVDIVKAAAARLGRPLEIRKMPFAGIMPSVKCHEADFAAAAITITEGRSRDVDFSIPYAEEGSAFLYRANEPMPTMVTVEKLRVGTVESMTHDYYLTRHGIDPIRYKSIEQAFADFEARKLDTVMYDRPALVELIRVTGSRLAVSPLQTREYYGIAVRKDRHDYLDAVNAVIRERKSK